VQSAGRAKRFTVEFEKYFCGGLLEGIEITETMPFVDWADACDWAAAVTRAPNVDYVIPAMRGPNGETARF